MSGKHRQTYSIVVRDKIYKIHALDTPKETHFILTDSNKLVCTITYGEGKWKADKSVNADDLNQIVKWIEELFL